MHSQVAGAAVLRAFQAHTGHARGVPQHFIEHAVGFEDDLAGLHLVHQLVDHDGFGFEFVAAVDQVHLGGDVGQVQGFFHGGVAAADHAHGLVPVEKTIAGGAARNTAAHEALLGGQAQVLGRSASGDDQRVAGVGAAVTKQGERALGEIHLVDVVEHHLGVEAFGVFQKTLHQVGALNAMHIGWPVVDFGGGHQLAALGHAGDQGGLQVGAGGINGGGVTGGAGTQNEYFAVLGGGHGEGL